MPKLNALAPALMESWAVANFAKTGQVGIKINDVPPFVMSAEEVKDLAAAINAELEEVDCAPSLPPLQVSLITD